MSTEEPLALAKERLRIADHFLTQTYPLVQDPKLLVSALTGITEALDHVTTAILERERSDGRIGAYHNTVAGRHEALRTVAKRYELSTIDLAMIEEMHGLLRAHSTSEMEFARHGMYVMAQKNFDLTTLTLEKIKTYLVRAKTLLAKTHANIPPPRRN